MDKKNTKNVPSGIESRCSRQVLARLVAFPTVSDQSNLDLIEYICEFLRSHDVKFHTLPNEDKDKASVVAHIGPDIDGGIALSAHTDVVPVLGQPWSGDPFKLRTIGTRLVGRGATDMKGFLASVLASVPDMVQRRLQLPVQLIFSYDEEIGCRGVLPAIQCFGRDVPVPRSVIVGEPTDLKIVGAHKSILSLRTVISGRSGHSSAPALGVNTIEFGCLFVRHLNQLAHELTLVPADSMWSDPACTTIHVGRFRSGIAQNIIPDRCEIEWEIRSTESFDSHRFFHDLEVWLNQDVLPEMRKTAPESDIVTSFVRPKVPGLSPMPDSAALSLACRLVEDDTVIGVPYGTEAGQFQNAGVSAVVLGPGSIRQAHIADEFIETDQLIQCDQMIGRLIHLAENP